MMQIRPYRPDDLEPLLTVFRKNVPDAFAPNEVGEYADFLRVNSDPYFVADLSGLVVGACGHYSKQDGRDWHICWIFSDPDHKGSGIGTALLTHNLDAIRSQPGIQIITCRTSQVAYRFFKKFGFQLDYTTPDFWAPGLDLYFMTRPGGFPAEADLT